MRALLMVTLLGGSLLLSSCNEFTTGCRSGYVATDTATLQRDLNAARARWTASGIQDYTYTIAPSIAAPSSPRTVVVRSGQVVSPDGAHTVPQLFDDLQATIAQPETNRCVSTTMTFDAVDGHPLRLSIIQYQPGIVDGFGGYAVISFSSP